ncbi:uncharacterized protein LOC131859078 [Cryptomeria japonica]|uniref:uncharacterized protein LOC131859078 n=1 Tax=Cryptomeria japonica TaxID=3369 RepID=UPI0027DA64A5|nr:uncharacterized protein LOC131859078 [Cryptomeria japonica]
MAISQGAALRWLGGAPVALAGGGGQGPALQWPGGDLVARGFLAAGGPGQGFPAAVVVAQLGRKEAGGRCKASDGGQGGGRRAAGAAEASGGGDVEGSGPGSSGGWGGEAASKWRLESSSVGVLQAPGARKRWRYHRWEAASVGGLSTGRSSGGSVGAECWEEKVADENESRGRQGLEPEVERGRTTRLATRQGPHVRGVAVGGVFFRAIGVKVERWLWVGGGCCGRQGLGVLAELHPVCGEGQWGVHDTWWGEGVWLQGSVVSMASFFGRWDL